MNPPGGPAAGRRLRLLLRQGEVGLIVLSCLVGAVAGACVGAVSKGAHLLHLVLYGAGAGRSLSAMAALPSRWSALVPAAGGVLVGLSLLASRRRPRPVDPVEANALRGGRMSVGDSLFIAFQTVVSNGFGASVGTEAAYTQLGSGLASWAGSTLRLRRSDMRTVVGAGSAGAIAAAFGAPVAGTFYAFELIIGSYTPVALAPVAAAAIAGMLVSRGLGVGVAAAGPSWGPVPGLAALAVVLVMTVLCSAVGVVVMRAVGWIEGLLRRGRIPPWLQPTLGGLALGAMALVTPRVLSGGHGALEALLDGAPPGVATLALTIGLKGLASAVSIGSGFRGGLFFASLLLGGATGEFVHALAPASWTGPALDAPACAVVGMAAMSAAIVGGPLTMTFLAVETTGAYPLALVVFGTAALVSVVMRRTFGYSFTTWRMHLRGETIRSGLDVGWMRELTVGSMMRSDAPTVYADMRVAGFVEAVPLGSAQWVAAVDPFGRYVGMIGVAEAHAAAAEGGAGAVLLPLLRLGGVTLAPDLDVRAAARLFERHECEALAVTGAGDRRVLGLLTEAHLLRRYARELEGARRALVGERP